MEVWDESGHVTDDFILVARRLLLDLTETELEREPLVELASDSGAGGGSGSWPIPSYALKLGSDIESTRRGTWQTVGHPIWTSYPLVGCGTTVWMAASMGSTPALTVIAKSAWRQGRRQTESSIYEYLKQKGLTGKPGIADFLVGQDVKFAGHDGSDTELSVNALRPIDAFLDHNILLHRVILTSVGRPLWEYNTPVQFIRTLLAIVNGECYLYA